MKKPYKYIFRKQGANVALVAISTSKLNRTKQHQIVSDYITNRDPTEFVTRSGKIVIYNDVRKTTSLNERRRVS